MLFLSALLQSAALSASAFCAAIRKDLQTLSVHWCSTWSCRLALCAVGHSQSGVVDAQVQHLVEEARSKASSIQQSVSKALTGRSEEGFTMGMRSNLPSYAPQPAFVRFLKSGALPSFLLCPSACLSVIQGVRCAPQHPSMPLSLPSCDPRRQVRS